jgi:hypothetical protein
MSANDGWFQSEFNIITHETTRRTSLEVAFPFKTCSPLLIYPIKYQFAVTFIRSPFLATILRRIKEHRININCLKRFEALVVNTCNKIPSDQPDDGERTGVCFKPYLNAVVKLTGF